MATLSDICVLPTEWEVRAEQKEHEVEVRLSKKLAWKVERKKQHERYKAHLAKVARKQHVESMSSSRRRVACETMPESTRIETCREMFFAGQGKRQPKKAKNRYSSEQAGTVGRIITTKRFEGSRITCVCKSRVL